MKQDEINAKKAASPNGLTDQYIKGKSGVSAEVHVKDVNPVNRMDVE